ncbi:MAG: DUF2812 domain-containing protein [Clostridia bacterium]|nr:DUF2812 domain-containing protein [Clostridia bacterium]
MISQHKLFFAWNEDKEMDYLQKMARKGYIFHHTNFFNYYFEEKEPESINYAADFKGFDKMPEEEYLQLFEDAGWTMVCRYGAWYYFKNMDMDALLYNDYHSVQNKYKKLLLFLLIVGLPLYYQLFIFLPRMSNEALTGFLFGFRLFVYFIVILHFSATLKIFKLYLKFSKNIHE